ncbi:MAG: S-layer homology domain-containing protein [Lawsonibacter sp.]|nr:S-layer homology domain-containing protein [Lawsonibacter sp.]
MKKVMAFVMSIILVCGISIPALAAGSGAMTQDQTQGQTQDQTSQSQTQGQTQDQTQSQTQNQTQSQTQDQTRDRTQEQIRDRLKDQGCQQTEVSAAQREQAKLQIRNQFQISDRANTQYQQRMQQMEQNGSCFNDTDQHWAMAQINLAYCWGLTNGYPDGGFNPDGKISGLGGILMASQLMNCLNGESSTETAENSIDWNLVPEWAKEQLQETTTLRIATQSQCYGETQLNRLQFAVMLAKAAEIEPAEVSADTVVFLDQSDIPAQDLGYIETLRALGIIQGNDGCFSPNRAVTRAEAAVMLTKMLGVFE